jgi:hypothetical protein
MQSLTVKFGKPGIKKRDPGNAINAFEMVENRVPLLA